ncbi:1-aminocyclopropane-1-carboxylate oxidase homolog 1-like [Coffea arabica]|uniref:1-aminocyclopropane-1-carboxylate oxidase homolog 1-like n=1 Tax=Coffea arabica TaxID=13443 RepID=A0A6P6TVX2_COFAR
MEPQLKHDRAREIKEFRETKAGVKGLVDSGMVRIPRMFVHDEKVLAEYPTNNNLLVPLIHLKDLQYGDHQRKEIVDQIRGALETWGFFQLINHGIPISKLDKLLECQKQFHEQPTEVKSELYSHDPKQSVKFFTTSSLDGNQPTDWRDTFSFRFPEDILDPHGLPTICREAVVSYMECLLKLEDTLSGLFSEALGLNRDYLSRNGWLKGGRFACHYYPTCPEPHLTLGARQHSDPSFLTILLQEDVGGLQLLHQNQWVDVPPTKGALVVNAGDFMQLISNDKFKSVKHRVLAKSDVPRLSAGCFFNRSSKPIGPLKELLSDTNPPIYREIHLSEYYTDYTSKWTHGTRLIDRFRI